MKYLAFMTIVLLLDIRIGNINILPDCIGWVLMYSVFSKLYEDGEDGIYKKLKSCTAIFAAVDVVLEIVVLLEHRIVTPYYFFKFISIVVSFYMLYMVLEGIDWISSKYGKKSDTESALKYIKTAPVWYLAATVIGYFDIANLEQLCFAVTAGAAVLLAYSLQKSGENLRDI